MAKIVYRDLDRTAPRIVWRGVTFLDGVPVTVEDDALVSKARGNRFFEVVDADPFDDLVMQARALGVQVDGRWGEARLREEIARAGGKA